MLEDAIRYGNEREAFGKPLMKFQVWRHKFVEHLTAFAHDYAAQARQDHHLFVDAFRAGRTAFANVRG